MAHILNIPTEARLIIFRHLFRDAKVVISQGCAKSTAYVEITKNVDNAIIYTCSRLHAEGGPVLASSLHIEFVGTDTGDLPPSLASYYYSCVRHVTVRLGSQQWLNAGLFTGLRSLTIQRGTEECPNLFSPPIKRPVPTSKKAMIQFIQGDYDEKFKRSCKESYVDKRAKCYPDVYTRVGAQLRDPTRSYQMIERAVGYWDTRDNDQCIRGTLELTYDLDTMQTLKRRAYCDIHWDFDEVARREHWEDGVIETWFYDIYGSEESVGGYFLISTRPWEAERNACQHQAEAKKYLSPYKQRGVSGRGTAGQRGVPGCA